MALRPYVNGPLSLTMGPPCHALRVHWTQLGGLQPLSGAKGTKGLNLHRLLVPHKPVAALASTAVFVENSGRCAPWAVFIDEPRNFLPVGRRVRQAQAGGGGGRRRRGGRQREGAHQDGCC